MWSKLRQIWSIPDLRKRILFVFGMLVIFRLISNVPIPGVNIGNLQNFFQSNQFLGLLNIFSGGALSNFSIALLGVGPYITASIIFQLLASIVPSLSELQKEGFSGQQKLNQYTRLATIPLAALQGYSTIVLLQRSGAGILGTLSAWQWIISIATVTAGSVLLMWIGELISEKKVGNGGSLIIFAGIIASLPTIAQQSVAVFDASQLLTIGAFIALAFITIVGVVFITEGQRKIPIVYARQMRGRSAGGAKSFLPLRVNQAGVIPIIFAISLLLFPTFLAQFFVSSSYPWLANVATNVLTFFNQNLWYASLYFILVFVFTYFYTSVIFHPDQIAENLQRQGAFIPGIRPGEPTAVYLKNVSQRILLAGAAFLGLIAILPIMVQSAFQLNALSLGGTSLLIVVSVVLESIKQIEAQIVTRDYESF